ncbi:MAG TPA: glycine cleavage system aminomethyltransferase GcvT [Streptosporangiaceae bacterium]|nr:glycine cleavage system aminomethyltransferase GcvT [Streptosporangiaceae bacterium]
MMTRDEAQPAGGQPRPTPLRAVHERLGASMTPFAGWLMPLRYSSEIAEHRAVRGAAGLFDLSHMGEIAVSGPGAAAALDYALTGHLSALKPGRARYTMICAPDGGVLDDLIVYRLADTEFLVVANAANTAVVAAALRERAAGRAAQVDDRTGDYALIAIQGPHASRILAPLADIGLDQVRYYAGQPAVVAGREVLLARTGYTGEDGFELFTSPGDAEPVWMALAAAGESDGLVPAGLAARDTLRLEAGMPLYGNELGPDVTPFDAGLGRVVVFDKPGDFVGRAALAARAQAAPARVLAGLTAGSRRVPRHGYPVLWDGQPAGVVTSGAPSPTLGVPIAMAYLDPGTARLAAEDAASARLAVDIRGSAEPAHITGLPFYQRPR